jgi:hypothetical protein
MGGGGLGDGEKSEEIRDRRVFKGNS